jgi:hypothetical protein
MSNKLFTLSAERGHALIQHPLHIAVFGEPRQRSMYLSTIVDSIGPRGVSGPRNHLAMASQSRPRTSAYSRNN